jgi:hypothetical protein
MMDKLMRIFIGGTVTGTLRHISAESYRQHCGMLTSWADASLPTLANRAGSVWAMDNFAFVKFDAARFERFLDRCAEFSRPLFCVAPDVWGDAKATAHLFDRWRDRIADFGYPVALAAQDGLDRVGFDWHAIDALFVGGTNQFKASPYVASLVAEARRRGIHTHNGRVNGRHRWNMSLATGFDSVDGSGLAIKRSRIHEALAVIANPQMYLL